MPKKLNILKTEFIPDIIIACCILHNICMCNEDTIDNDNITAENYVEVFNEEQTINGSTKSDYLCDILLH